MTALLTVLCCCTPGGGGNDLPGNCPCRADTSTRTVHISGLSIDYAGGMHICDGIVLVNGLTNCAKSGVPGVGAPYPCGGIGFPFNQVDLGCGYNAGTDTHTWFVILRFTLPILGLIQFGGANDPDGIGSYNFVSETLSSNPSVFSVQVGTVSVS